MKAKSWIIGLGIVFAILNILDFVSSYNKLVLENNPFSKSVLIMIAIKLTAILFMIWIIKYCLKENPNGYKFFFLSFLTFVCMALLIILPFNFMTTQDKAQQTQQMIQNWEEEGNLTAINDFERNQTTSYFYQIFLLMIYPLIGSMITYLFYSKAIMIKPANKNTIGIKT